VILTIIGRRARLAVDTDYHGVNIKVVTYVVIAMNDSINFCFMQARHRYSWLLILMGLAVSIAPVRAHYALTTGGETPCRSSSLLPRAQQRIRLVSMRTGSEKSARVCSHHSGPAAVHFASRVQTPTSRELAPTYPIAGHATLSCLGHPLRC
jgi:hypothetical protein